MNGFAAPTAAGLAFVGACLFVHLSAGLCAAGGSRPRAVWRAGAWALLLLTAAAGVWATHDEPGGNRVLSLCMGLFLAVKVLVTVETRLARRRSATGLAWLAFALTWPGMRPGAFTRPWSAPRPGSGRLIAEGCLAMLLGVVCLGLARHVGLAVFHGVPATLLALAGLGFLLHVGSFRVLAGFWRARGVAVVPLFDAPHRATSLAEFWAKRWNLAFSEMLQLIVQRPLAPRFGPARATYAAFLFSGLLHEAALSLPARGGYGLPLLYFAVHGILVGLEPQLGISPGPSTGPGHARSTFLRRLWTLSWAALPGLLVFHPAALRAAVWPLLV